MKSSWQDSVRWTAADDPLQVAPILKMIPESVLLLLVAKLHLGGILLAISISSSGVPTQNIPHYRWSWLSNEEWRSNTTTGGSGATNETCWVHALGSLLNCSQSTLQTCSSNFQEFKENYLMKFHNILMLQPLHDHNFIDKVICRIRSFAPSPPCKLQVSGWFSFADNLSQTTDIFSIQLRYVHELHSSLTVAFWHGLWKLLWIMQIHLVSVF